MRKGMLVVALMAISFAAGWQLSPDRFPYLYRTRAGMLVTDATGKVLAAVPIGTPLLSRSRVVQGGDIGWWACVPVAMGTMAEAERLVTASPESPKRIPWDLAFNGVSPADSPKAGGEKLEGNKGR